MAVEATSLLGPRTGIGTMTDAVVRRLATMDDLAVTGVLISFRGRGQLPGALPAGVAAAAIPFPARLAHRLWTRLDRPRLTGFDVVHGPNFVVPPAAGAAEVVTVHDFGPWHHPDQVGVHARRYPALVGRAVNRGAAVHVVSAFVAAEARTVLGVDDDRIHVVPNGFEPAPPGDPARGRALAGGRPYVLSLGTIEPRKAVPDLIEAMVEVWRDHPEVALVVAGADGAGTPAVDAALRRVGAVVTGADATRRRGEGAPSAAGTGGVGRRVVRLGYVTVDERNDLLAGAACFAFPSIYEGFGLPPLEAMGQGCPVVATTAGALVEVCGPAARLVPPGDPGALAAAVVTVIGDDAEAARLREAGRARVGTFSWDATAAGLAALYRHLTHT